MSQVGARGRWGGGEIRLPLARRLYRLQDIWLWGHTGCVLIDWPADFDRWYDDLERRAEADEGNAKEVLLMVTAALKHLQDLSEPPDDETATLKRVRQSKCYPVWRVSHPYRPGVAVRLICWFPPETGTVVVALFAADKAQMGDVFYNSVGPRADGIIDQWKREQEDS